jgi:hypothetical protein
MLVSTLDRTRGLLSPVDIKECPEVTFVDLTHQVDRDWTHNRDWSHFGAGQGSTNRTHPVTSTGASGHPENC